jgi:hypothetical protein
VTRALRVPGQDASGSAKGVFAGLVQGATPKYAINNGYRSDLFRNTLARMFVRVDASEMNTFLGSIADSHTRSQLANRIAGDPTSQQGDAQTGGGATQDSSVARRRTVQSNGYLDFLIQSVQMQLQEKVQVSETLSDNYVAYTFGQSPPMWSFQGVLINTVQDDQASNMFRLYSQILRATQMARRQKSMSMSFDSYVVNGVMTNLTMNLTSQNEVMVPFSFQLLVKRVFITNFTRGWVPTTAGTPFSADLNAIAYDGRPREEASLSRIAARTQSDSEPDSTPTPQDQADARTTLASGVENGTATPNFTPAPQASFAGTTGASTTTSAASSPAFTPAPLVSQAPATPIAPTASVENVSRPETVNASGVSTNSNVAPGSPASTQSGSPNYQAASFSNISAATPGGTNLAASNQQVSAEQDVIFNSAGGVLRSTSMSTSGNAAPTNQSPGAQYEAAVGRQDQARQQSYNSQVVVRVNANGSRSVYLPDGPNPDDPSSQQLARMSASRSTEQASDSASASYLSRLFR